MPKPQDKSAETTIASERIYSGRVINLRLDTVVLPNGRSHQREIVEHRGAVAVAAVDETGQVLMVRQYRKAAGKRLLELPAGTLEAGEDARHCAERELEEETGFRAEKWQFLASFYTSPGFCTELLHVYLATELQPGVAAGEEDEQIEVSRMPLSETTGLIARGEICDAKTIAGLLLARDRVGK